MLIYINLQYEIYELQYAREGFLFLLAQCEVLVVLLNIQCPVVGVSAVVNILELCEHLTGQTQGWGWH